jgi:hypothetical protein
MPRRLAALIATIVVALLAAGALVHAQSLPDCTTQPCTYLPLVLRSLPQPTATATIQPTPTPPATVRVVSSRSYTSIGDTRSVVGEVINGRTSTAYSVQVAATFYDAANTLVADEEGYALLTRMLPGQKAPFRILLSQAPPSIVRYELTVTWQNSSVLDYRPATILSQQVRDNFGPEIFGELRNDQTRPLRTILVAVAFYDAAGNVVDVDTGSIDATELAPGATSIYQVSTFKDDLTFTTYLVQAEGYFPP